MASLPILTILEQSQVSPPPATVSHRSLPLTLFDIPWLSFPPVHHLFFYELPLTKTRFTETIVPNLKHSLSIALQHFFPFAGNLIIFPDPTRKPEIRYLEDDSVELTIAECSLDFDDLTGNHRRSCGQFYHLIPQLSQTVKDSDHLKIPVFSVQVTVFPNHGFSIGMTNHHSLGDASTRFRFLKAWTSIARSDSDEPVLTEETMPVYDREVKYPEAEESYLKDARVDILYEKYQPLRLSVSEPTDKVRVTYVLTRTVTGRLKKLVLTHMPTLPYVSSFTVACGYIWSCIAKSRNDESELFFISIDCRGRTDPPYPAAYFGNCVMPCMTLAKTTVLTGKEGFVTAVKLLGENLHKILTDKDGIVKDVGPAMAELFSGGMPSTIMGVAGSPKLQFYDLDFGWGKPKKHEIISIDYNDSISVSACKDCNEDFEIGVCLPATTMEAFVGIFNDGLEFQI